MVRMSTASGMQHGGKKGTAFLRMNLIFCEISNVCLVYTESL